MSAVLSEVPPGSGATGRRRTGGINADRVRRHAGELPDAVRYVTGPASLVTDVVATLRDTGVPRARIRLSDQSLPFPPERRP